MIIEALKLFFGFIFLFLIPGYIFTKILFRNELDRIEEIALSIGLSLSINIFIGLMLSFNKLLTFFNLWISVLAVSFALLLIYFIKR